MSKILVVKDGKVASEGRVTIIAQSKPERELVDVVELLAKKLERSDSVWARLKILGVGLGCFALGYLASQI